MPHGSIIPGARPFTLTVPARSGRRRSLAHLATAIVAVAVIVGATASSAVAAEKNAWSWSHSGAQTHLYTTWSDNSTYLTHLKVQHLAEDRTLCETQGQAWGTRVNNGTQTTWGKTFGYTASCGWTVGTAVVSPNIYFAGGSPVYGQFYHDGAWAPGSPWVLA
jgi:hypothetical protein